MFHDLWCSVDKKESIEVGAGIGDYRYWAPITLTFLLIAIPVVYFFSASADFQQYYAQKDFDFTQYLINTTVLMIGWEYFFRGFMTMSPKTHTQRKQHFDSDDSFYAASSWETCRETLACIPSGLFWGYVCYRAESFGPH